MIDKIVRSMAEAMDGVKDGAVVLLGGFGAVGQPNALIEQGAKDLTVACNNVGVGRLGLARLMDLGWVHKCGAICIRSAHFASLHAPYCVSSFSVIWEQPSAGACNLFLAAFDGRARQRQPRVAETLQHLAIGRAAQSAA